MLVTSVMCVTSLPRLKVCRHQRRHLGGVDAARARFCIYLVSGTQVVVLESYLNPGALLRLSLVGVHNQPPLLVLHCRMDSLKRHSDVFFAGT